VIIHKEHTTMRRMIRIAIEFVALVALVALIIGQAVAMLAPTAVAAAPVAQREYWTVGDVSSCDIAGSRAQCFTLRRFAGQKEVESIRAYSPDAINDTDPRAGAVSCIAQPSGMGYGRIDIRLNDGTVIKNIDWRRQ
jgi:hypothetical protein